MITESEALAAAIDAIADTMPSGATRTDCLRKLLELGVESAEAMRAQRASKRRATLKVAHESFAGLSTAGFREEQLAGWPE